ncbi:HAMP domain-containing protein [Demequina litorisediminis]|uniref:HAMP domain-containing protein n=1 Tax=Demequina litorisediminis TaxID=1849022 RepID=UPI0024E08E8D|nr:HAMP domain-containing protein [Demequina litorisediminis]
MSDEQDTLALIQQVLAIGAVVLVGLVVVMTWYVTNQAVRPVRQAARVASRLAEGRLSERMKVRGHDEMATLAQTFNDMAESLQRQITRMEHLSRLQRRFVSDVSHELRTPLTTIRMASDVLHDAREDFDPAAARSAELLSTQARQVRGAAGGPAGDLPHRRGRGAGGVRGDGCGRLGAR